MAKKNQMKRAPMSNFHSLSTYVDCTNFKSYFPRLLGHSYFLFPHVFYDFFHWNSLGPVEISYGLGGTKMSDYHSLSNLLFNWIPFHKNQFPQKIDSLHFNGQGANNSKSLFIISKFDLHVDIQLLKVRNEQNSLGFSVGHGRTIRYITLKWRVLKLTSTLKVAK